MTLDDRFLPNPEDTVACVKAFVGEQKKKAGAPKKKGEPGFVPMAERRRRAIAQWRKRKQAAA